MRIWVLIMLLLGISPATAGTLTVCLDETQTSYPIFALVEETDLTINTIVTNSTIDSIQRIMTPNKCNSAIIPEDSMTKWERSIAQKVGVVSYQYLAVYCTADIIDLSDWSNTTVVLVEHPTGSEIITLEKMFSALFAPNSPTPTVETIPGDATQKDNKCFAEYINRVGDLPLEKMVYGTNMHLIDSYNSDLSPIKGWGTHSLYHPTTINANNRSFDLLTARTVFVIVNQDSEEMSYHNLASIISVLEKNK